MVATPARSMWLTSWFPLSRRAFIALCLIGGAVLATLVGGTLISLALFGVSLLMVAAVALVMRHLDRQPADARWLVPLAIVVLIGIFIFSRFGRLQILIFGAPILRGGVWIGLSYLVFRLIHVLLDYREKRLPTIPAGELAAYALFPPALVAGPIHRANQFIPQLDQPRQPATSRQLADSLWRIGLGAIKKLVLANALALFALNVNMVYNPQLSRGVLWLAVIAYTFMLYFDFSGYSDIAIGAAALIGITLPENFANPYAQPNIARFWQTWHITLSTWLRDYLFFPISRRLLSRFGRRYAAPILAISHLTTMVLAGLWHGFGTGFIAWGAWHGLGLFAHAQWSGIARQRNITVPRALSVALTFLFVMIGWIFFALPDVGTGLHLIVRLITG